MNETPYKFNWDSSICGCSVTFFDGKREYRACETEHEPWLLIVGSQEIRRKLADIEKAIRRGIPSSFRFSLKRYGEIGTSFHRPKDVELSDTAPTAEMGFFLSESMGVGLTACANPTRYSDYLANKASRGLTEKMWLEDWNDGRGIPSMAPLSPAELVADPALCLPREEANRLFGIHMTSEAVALYKSIRRWSQQQTDRT